MTTIPSAIHLRMLTRLVMATITIAMLIRLLQHALPHQFLCPPLFGLGIEIPFWIYKFLHLDHILVYSQVWSVVFTSTIFLIAIVCFLLPERNYLFPVFSILFFLYYLSYDMFTILHSHPLTAMVWITIPFWTGSVRNRWLLWEAMRYYACFIYAVSFVHKIIGGSLFVWQNGENSVRLNLAQYLYQFPDTIHSGILSFTIAHPFVLNAGHLLVMIAEGLMVIGFFTKKYDRWLFWVPIIVHGTTYFFSDVYFLEFFVLVFLFLDDKQVAWIQRKIPVLAK